MSLPPRNAKVYAPSTQYGDMNKVLTAEPVTYNVFRAKTGIFGEKNALEKGPHSFTKPLSRKVRGFNLRGPFFGGFETPRCFTSALLLACILHLDFTN